MMRVLLDTHALIWALTDPDRLSTRSHAVLADRNSDVIVSAATAWEIATKVRIGKLPAAQAIVDGWATDLARFGAEELPVSARHALLAGSMRWPHRDPFDRMLAAQATLEDLPLVTTDAVFEELPSVRLLW